MPEFDLISCRTALSDTVARMLARGAKAELVDFVDPSAFIGEEAIDARKLIDRARAETSTARRSGQPNPLVLRNGIDGPGCKWWLDLRKSAIALHPLYEAGRWQLMGDGVTMDDISRPFPWGATPARELSALVGDDAAHRAIAKYEAFLNVPVADAPLTFMRGCLDAAAIRSRAAAAAFLVGERLERWSDEPVRMASLACGAAKPIARMAAEIAERGLAVERLTLLDRDPLALAAGRAVAEASAPDVRVEVVLSDLLVIAEMRAIDLLSVLGGQRQDVVEMLGLFEYLPDLLAIDLLRRAGAALRENGLIVFANMLTPRPEQDVFSDVIQWPAVIQRSMDEVLDLVEAAGYPPHSVSIIVPEGELIYQIVLIDTSV
ncbi:MAG TPA: class I SAM-dependent methyltransferase [Jatrophihabitans sp.]|nr:class I SAM-dependent methyltransferase [Jatrophihabitans sp.]